MTTQELVRKIMEIVANAEQEIEVKKQSAHSTYARIVDASTVYRKMKIEIKKLCQEEVNKQ